MHFGCKLVRLLNFSAWEEFIEVDMPDGYLIQICWDITISWSMTLKLLLLWHGKRSWAVSCQMVWLEFYQSTTDLVSLRFV